MKKFWLPLQQRVQDELIRRGHCVGCTRSLVEAEREIFDDEDNEEELVTCKCERVYIYEKLVNNYRRATVNELKSHKKK